MEKEEAAGSSAELRHKKCYLSSSSLFPTKNMPRGISSNSFVYVNDVAVPTNRGRLVLTIDHQVLSINSSPTPANARGRSSHAPSQRDAEGPRLNWDPSLEEELNLELGRRHAALAETVRNGFDNVAHAISRQGGFFNMMKNAANALEDDPRSSDISLRDRQIFNGNILVDRNPDQRSSYLIKLCPTGDFAGAEARMAFSITRRGAIELDTSKIDFGVSSSLADQIRQRRRIASDRERARVLRPEGRRSVNVAQPSANERSTARHTSANTNVRSTPRRSSTDVLSYPSVRQRTQSARSSTLPLTRAAQNPFTPNPFTPHPSARGPIAPYPQHYDQAAHPYSSALGQTPYSYPPAFDPTAYPPPPPPIFNPITGTFYPPAGAPSHVPYGAPGVPPQAFSGYVTSHVTQQHPALQNELIYPPFHVWLTQRQQILKQYENEPGADDYHKYLRKTARNMESSLNSMSADRPVTDNHVRGVYQTRLDRILTAIQNDEELRKEIFALGHRRTVHCVDNQIVSLLEQERLVRHAELTAKLESREMTLPDLIEPARKDFRLARIAEFGGACALEQGYLNESLEFALYVEDYLAEKWELQKNYSAYSRLFRVPESQMDAFKEQTEEAERGELFIQHLNSLDKDVNFKPWQTALRIHFRNDWEEANISLAALFSEIEKQQEDLDDLPEKPEDYARRSKKLSDQRKDAERTVMDSLYEALTNRAFKMYNLKEILDMGHSSQDLSLFRVDESRN